jgi:mono/diheme cytochrome c family protein
MHPSLSNRHTAVATLFTAALLTVAAPLQANAQAQLREESRLQQRIHEPGFGKREFDSNCAACHGMDAKGRGPVAGFLTKNPPDLTLLARGNGGVFPMDRLYRAIDGRDLPEGSQAGPHGSREMPIWGRDYRLRDGEYHGDTPYDADAMVRGRILALLEYLNRLQVR